MFLYNSFLADSVGPSAHLLFSKIAEYTFACWHCDDVFFPVVILIEMFKLALHTHINHRWKVHSAESGKLVKKV